MVSTCLLKHYRVLTWKVLRIVLESWHKESNALLRTVSWTQCFELPSELWYCWFDSRKYIWHIKTVPLIRKGSVNIFITIGTITSPPQSNLGRVHSRLSWQRMHSSAACVSCAISTGDMSNHSVVVCYIHTAVLHATFFLYIRPSLHCLIPSNKNLFLPVGDSIPPLKKSSTWPTTPNDIIGIHTPNYWDYCCTVNWFELVYGYLGPQTLHSLDTSVPTHNLYPKSNSNPAYHTNTTTTTAG